MLFRSKPLKLKITDLLLGILNDPFLKVSSFQLVVSVGGSILFCTVVSLLLKNPAVTIACFLVGALLPLVFFTLRSMTVQLQILTQNFNLVNAHHINFLEIPEFEKSIKKTMESFERDSRNYRKMELFLTSCSGLGKVPDESIDYLVDELNAEYCVKKIGRAHV